MKKDTVSVDVICKFRINDVCTEEDLEGTTLEKMVMWLLDEEGLFGIASDKGKILSIERVECST